ncbi:unnamed protein product [Effrenium voratum]|uniref:Uncharacterized protein n=1 Tax=Effrenium voratum TaxID=2562239 RepID=A0AA36MSW3_9DINO|nr:unnamed protein product [Effrenium voratum]
MALAPGCRVLPEALHYFLPRAQQEGTRLVVKLKARASLGHLEQKLRDQVLAPEVDPDTLTLATEMAAQCVREQRRHEEFYTRDVITALQLLRNNTTRALKFAREALALARHLGDPDLVASALGSLELVQLIREEGEVAAAGFHMAVNKDPQRAEEVSKELGEKRPKGYSDLLRGLLGGGFSFLQLRGQLMVLDFAAWKLRQDADALRLAREAEEEAAPHATDLEKGLAQLLLGKLQLRSPESLRFFQRAAQHFAAAQANLGEAAAHSAAAAALCEKLQETRGQAVALQTLANCKMVQGVNDPEDAYRAMRLFAQCGDKQGEGMCRKLLLNLGQSEQQIKSSLDSSKDVAKFEGLDAGKAEEQRQREEHLRTIFEEQVVWEYSWVPSETQDPKHFGEKHSGAVRKIFAASELKDRKLLQQLSRCRARRTKSQPPSFANLINGRLLTASSMQSAMEAASCLAVVYDTTRLSHLTPLEVVDVAIRLVQALQVIDEPRVALDIVNASTQQIGYTQGVRTPFHSTLWGFIRTAGMENPENEIRMLDIDAGRWKEDVAFVCRYLLGAQKVRPFEAIIRNGGLQVARLVSARMRLRPPLKLDG